MLVSSKEVQTVVLEIVEGLWLAGSMVITIFYWVKMFHMFGNVCIFAIGVISIGPQAHNLTMRDPTTQGASLARLGPASPTLLGASVGPQSPNCVFPV